MSSPELSLDKSLLRTGFHPDELQPKRIKAAIVAQREAIEAIDSQISDFEQRIVDLRKNRQHISEKMAVNEALLAPIRRVAPEILCQIFGHCLPHEPTRNTTIPLSLMGVCYTWRRIVQETSQLWAQIYVDPRTRLSLVEKFLRNSLLVPLDVTMELGYGDFDNASEAGGDWGVPVQDQCTIVTETTMIIQVISQQHRRIRRLSLCGPYSILSTLFPSRFRTKTSLLEHLTINCPNIPWVESRFRLKGGRLRTLNVNGKILSIISINRTFGLRRMSLQGTIPLLKLLQFLRVSPALEELTMENFRSWGWNEQPDIEDLDLEPILLTKLSLFEINWDAENYGSLRQSPIRHMRTPAVKSLSFKFKHDTRQLDDLYNLLTSSAKSVVCLSLEGVKCNPYQFFRMVGGLSVLEALKLADLRIKGMWEIFTPEKDANPNDWICPKLTTLELREVDLDETFLACVCRRTRPIQSGSIQTGFHYLRSVVISQQYVNPDVSSPLEILESEREDFFLELRDCRDRRWT